MTKPTLAFLSSSDRPVGDYTRLNLIRHELNAILQREYKCHEMDSSPGLDNMLEEVITIMEEWLDYEPSDAELSPGEPPLTADEMHSAAWKEHQEAHK